MNQYLDLDAKLAALLGYTDIDIIDVSTHSKFVSAFPPGQAPTTSIFDRVTVPAWCCTTSARDTGAIVDLMATYSVGVVWYDSSVAVVVQSPDGVHGAGFGVLFRQHPDKVTALRVAVVNAVIKLLTP